MALGNCFLSTGCLPIKPVGRAGTFLKYYINFSIDWDIQKMLPKKDFFEKNVKKKFQSVLLRIDTSGLQPYKQKGDISGS